MRDIRVLCVVWVLVGCGSQTSRDERAISADTASAQRREVIDSAAASGTDSTGGVIGRDSVISPPTVRNAKGRAVPRDTM